MSYISTTLIKVIKDTLKKIYNYEDETNLVMVEIPKDINHGDYSTNIAMRLTKILKMNPREIASNLVSEFEKDEFIEKCEIAGPGFINFFLKKEGISRVLKEVLSNPETYGKTPLESSPHKEKIMVEYVSANPTGDLHLGHARGAAYGDALTRILKYTGYDVLREYYVNDGGNQIETLGYSLLERYKEALSLPSDIEKIGYQGKDVKELAKKIALEEGDKYIKVDEKEALEYFKKIGTKLELEKIQRDLELYRVSFDHYQSELELYTSGKVENALNLLKNSEYTYENEGALWLKTTEFSDDKDRVLVKSDKTLTYLTPDIAYHKDKFDRGYDELIDILGADHHGYMARLRAGIKVLGYDPSKLNFLIVQIVRLMEDGNEVKMSKRTGNAVTIRELCEDVGVDVARFFFISKPIDSHLDFDLTLARSQSSDNPIYYIQYAYARCSSILRRNSNYEIKEEYSFLNNQKEIELIKHLDIFKDVIDDIAINKEVNKLGNYLYKSAQLFHSYYNETKILDDNNIDLTKERLALVKSISIILNIGLSLLGIEVKEEM